MLARSGKFGITKKYQMELQKKPEKPPTIGKSGAHYVAMVTSLIILYCTGHILESCCQES